MPSTEIIFTLCFRPFYTKQVLDAWENVDGFDKHSYTFAIDPVPQEKPNQITEHQIDEVEAWHARHPELDVTINTNAENFGVSLNPLNAIDNAFAMGADRVILAEEDVMPSRDALNYLNWALGFVEGSTIAACCQDSRHATTYRPDPTKVYEGTWFTPWLWGTTAEAWYTSIHPTWDTDYSTADERGPGGWDCNLGLRVMPDNGLLALFPERPRSQHIGDHLGMHNRGPIKRHRDFVQDSGFAVFQF